MSQPDSFIVHRVLESWKQCLDLWSEHNPARGLQEQSHDEIGLVLKSGAERISARYDEFANLLGGKFARGDGRALRQLNEVAEVDMAQIQQLIQLRSIAPQLLTQEALSIPTLVRTSSPALVPPATASSPTTAESRSWEAEAENHANVAAEKTVQILNHLAVRVGYVPPRPSRQPQRSKRPKDPFLTLNIPYCEGALKLQESTANIFSIASKTEDRFRFTCRYCYLEISSFQLCATNYILDDWSLLASCHVLACRSFKDPRAGFRCPTCYSNGLNTVEPCATTMREHLRSCKFRGEKSRERRKISDTGPNSATYYLPTTPIAGRPPPAPQAGFGLKSPTAHPPPAGSQLQESSRPVNSETSQRPATPTTEPAKADPVHPYSGAGETQRSTTPPPKYEPTPAPQPTTPDQSRGSSNRQTPIPQPYPTTLSVSRDGQATPSRTANPRAQPNHAAGPLISPPALPVRGIIPPVHIQAPTTRSPRQWWTGAEGAVEHTNYVPGGFPADTLSPRSPTVGNRSPSTATSTTTATATISPASPRPGTGESVLGRGRAKRLTKQHQSDLATAPERSANYPGGGAAAEVAITAADAAKLDQMIEMGVPRAHAVSSLRDAGGDVAAALDLLFGEGTR